MTSIDEQVAHALADRQIQLFRFAANQTNVARKLLAALSASVIDLLRSYGSTPLNKRQLDAIRAKVKQLTRSAYQQIEQGSSSELMGLEESEAVAVAAILTGIVGSKFDVPKLHGTSPVMLGVPLSDYWQQSADATELAIYSVVANDALNGKKPTNTAEHPDLMLESRKNGSDGLLNTAVQSIAGIAKMAVFAASALTHGYIHTSILDGKTSIMCRARSGAMWDADFRPINGTALDFEMPPLHRHCRSFMRPYFGGEVAKVNHETWLNSKTIEQQNSMLGKGRAELWRRGVITFKDMIDQTGRPLNLVELKDLHMDA